MALTFVVDVVDSCDSGSVNAVVPKSVYRYSANTFQFCAIATETPAPAVHPLEYLFTASSAPAVALLSVPVSWVRTYWLLDQAYPAVP
jgi:hypothetical protein